MALSSEYYWVPVPGDEAFVLAKAERLEGSKAVCTPLEGGAAAVTAPLADCYEVSDPAAAKQVVADMVQMHEVNRASILHVLRERYGTGDIYTSMGSVLVATNPFEFIPKVYAPALLCRFVDEATAGAARGRCTGTSP